MLETHAVVTPPKPGFLERLVWHDIQDGRVVKFAPDQPRDEQGRWTDVSAGGELRHVYASPTNDWAIAGFGDRQVRWAQRAYAPWRHGLTADEQAALVHYVGTGWRDINPVLRDVKYPPNPAFYTEEQTQRDIASIDAALSATQTNREVSSWRIVDNAHGSDKPGGYDTLVNMPVGSTFTDPGYVSTSLRPDIVDYFGTPGGESKYATVQINVPSGTHAAYMFGGALSPGQHDMSDERELLIHRNATFKVVSKSTGMVYGKPVLHVALDLLPESKAYDPAESRDPRGEWTASTVTQAAHLTKATGIPSDFTGLNPHQTQALVKTFERLHQQYPLKVMPIDYVGGTHAPSDPYAKLPYPDHEWGHEQTALAQTANYGKGGAYIGLNPVKFSGPANSPYSALGILQRSVDLGWYPPEARDTGYIAAHEFGHVISDEATNQPRAWKTVFDFLSKWDGFKGEQLSKYAAANGEELFAEAFAAHYYGSTNPIAEDMGKLLTTVFGSAPTFASKAFDPSEARDPHGEWTGGSSEPVFDKATADALTLDITGDTGIGKALKNHTDAVNGILRRLPKSATDLLIHGQRQDIAEESPRYQVRRMLSMWAGGSSGSMSRLLLQKAAIEEFGASPNARNKTEHELAQLIAEGRYEHDLAADARVLADEDARKRRVAWYRAVLRVMYDNTQAYLKERGITRVPVSRGIGYYDTPSWLRDMPGNQPVPRETKNLFPLTSWSTSTKAAGVFAGVSRASRTGVLLRATVPASRVLSFPMTGLGATDESEVVLLDGPGQALVEKLVMRPDGSSGSEKAFDSEEPRDLHGEWDRSRNTDIAAALQKDFPSLASVDLHNFTPRSASAIATEFRKLAAEYPKVAKYHVSAIEALNPALGHGTALAVTTTQGALQFNPVWFGSDDAWDMMVDKSESGGFHRRGLVSREAVVDHEFGHLVAEALPLVPRTQFIADEYVNSNQGMLEAALGKYGASRSGEALAESFAIMRNRPQAEWQWFTDDYAKLLTQNQASLKSRELKGPQELLDYSGEAPESLAASGIDPASLVTTADELALRRQLEQLYASVLENTHQALQTQLGAQWGLSPDAVDAYRAQAGDAASGIIETTRSVMSPVMADVIEAGRTAERLGVGFNVREILMQALRDLWVFGPQRGEKIGLTEVVKATNQSVALSLMSAFLQGIEFPQGELVGLRYTDGDETSPWGPCGMFTHDDPVKMNGFIWRFDSGPMPPPSAHTWCVRAAYPFFEELQQPPGEDEEESKARQWRKTQKKLRGLWAVLGVKYDPDELRDPHGRWTATIEPGASPHDIQAADRLILPDPATSAKPSDEQQKRARAGAVKKLTQRIMADPQAIAAFKRINGTTMSVSEREVESRVLMDMTDWGNSSRSPESLTMQRAAVDEFRLESSGLDHCITRAEQDFADEEAEHAKRAFLNDAQPPHDTQADLDRVIQQAREAAPAKMHAQMERLWTERGDWYRRELRHMYEQTQDAFKDAGITRVGLMRGLSWIKASDAPKPVQAAVYHIQHTHEPAELPIVSQPMTSWTARTNVVHNFTQRGPGLVLMATVPVERILSMPLTGHGNLTEHEYVVLAGPGKAEVHTTDLTHFRREAWPMMAEPKTAAIDIQAVWLEHAVLQDMLAKLVAQPSTAKLLAAQVELEQQSAWLLDVIANMQVKTTAPTRLRHVSQPLKLPWQRSEAGDDVEEPIDGGHWVTIGSNHVYIDGAGGSGSVLTDGQLGVTDGVIRELARLPTETIRVYDRSGKLLFSRTGSTERIQLSPDEIDLLRSEGAWAIHNHPEALGFPKGDPRRETGHSFSPDDVGMAIGQHMAETQVIAGNTLYTLRPGQDGWGSQSITEVQDAVNTEFEKVRVQYQGEIDSFRRTHANGVAHMWDTVWHRLAKRYGWHYSHTTVAGIDDKGALVLPCAQRMLNVCDVKKLWLADWRFVESKFEPGEPRDETGRWTDGTPIVPGADGDLLKRTDALIWGDKPGPMGNSPFLQPEVERQIHRANREAFITRVLSSERAMNAWNTTFVGPDKFYSDRLQDVPKRSQRERIHDSFLEDKQAWSQSATNATALALQRAAVEEFGLSSDSLTLRNRAVQREHLGPSLLKDADEEYAKYGPWLRAEVRTIYDLTQTRLRAAGVSHVALLRGLKWDDKKDVPQAINRVLPDMLNGKGEVELRQQPISSWTARKDVAERFAQTKYAVILKSTVPASRVFSFAGSGYGVMDEHEFLVLDSPGKASIEFQPYSNWPMDATADVLAHPGKYPAKEFDPNQARDEHGRWTSGQLEATPGDLAPAPLTEPSPPELSEQGKATLAEATRAIQTCLSNGTVHLDGVNPEYATQLAAQMQTLNKAWPELTKDLTFFGTPDVEWDKNDPHANDLSGWQHAQFTSQDYLTSAETRSGIPVPEPTSGGVRSSLVLNPRFWGNPPLMNATLEESARNHWTFSPGSDTVRATLTHEMGHVMIKYLMYRSPESRAAWDTFTKAHTKLAWATTSRYAATGAEEAFAEAFGALHCQKPEQWSTFTRAVAAYLDKQGVFKPPATKAFDPDQPRDPEGRWTAAGDVQPDALLPHYAGQYSALHDELSSDQRAAVENYIDTGYNFTNAKLRGTQPHTAGATMYVRTPEQIAEIVKQIDAAQLTHPLTQDTTVYRGAFTDDSGHYPAWTEPLQPGVEFTDHAFVSTTTDPGLVRRWFLHGLVHPTIMTINVPKGTPSLFLGHFNTPNYLGEDVDEHELLLARDLCYRVTSREITSDGLGTLHITAEVVPKVTA